MRDSNYTFRIFEHSILISNGKYKSISSRFRDTVNKDLIFNTMHKPCIFSHDKKTFVIILDYFKSKKYGNAVRYIS